MDAAERTRTCGMADATDPSEDTPATQEKSCRAKNLHVAFVADKELVEEGAQWWGPGMNARPNAATASPMEGVDAATSAWAADQCNKVLGKQ